MAGPVPGDATDGRLATGWRGKGGWR